MSRKHSSGDYAEGHIRPGRFFLAVQSCRVLLTSHLHEAGEVLLAAARRLCGIPRDPTSSARAAVADEGPEDGGELLLGEVAGIATGSLGASLRSPFSPSRPRSEIFLGGSYGQKQIRTLHSTMGAC
jgi:hypothetical protein